MAVKKKPPKTPSQRPLPPSALPQAPSTDKRGLGQGSDDTLVAYLKAQLEKSVCSSDLRELLEQLPSREFSEDAWVRLALAAIKFEIREAAWVQRALESSTQTQIVIEILLNAGVREAAPVARAIVREIARWDDNWASSSPYRIRRLSGYLVRLFEKDQSQRAAVLDEISAQDSSLRVMVDAILGRNTPEAIAKRSRWSARESSQPGDRSNDNLVLHETSDPTTASRDSSIGPTWEEVGEADGLQVLEDSEEQELSPSDEERQEGKRAEYLDALLKTVPQKIEYEEQVAKFEGLKREFDRRFAVRFLEVLKAEMQKDYRKHSNIEEKRSFVEWVNAQVKRVGLVFRNPKVDCAAMLIVDTGNKPELGRFQLRTEAEHTGTGKDETFSTPSLTTLLDKLELIVPPPRREGWAEFKKKRAGRQQGGAGLG